MPPDSHEGDRPLTQGKLAETRGTRLGRLERGHLDERKRQREEDKLEVEWPLYPPKGTPSSPGRSFPGKQDP